MGENVRPGGGKIFRIGATMISLSQREGKKRPYILYNLLYLSDNEEIS